MKIQAIQYGLTKSATQINLEWGNKEFFDDNVNLKVLLLDDAGGIMDIIEKKMTTDEYLLYGDTKEIRANAILTEMGITILPDPEIV
ncbi:MAG: hypothetical protein IE931_05510 [Sphingobacteriales bacterium]|nr:hypothetical protein [Sphingobacteriales bacterium]